MQLKITNMAAVKELFYLLIVKAKKDEFKWHIPKQSLVRIFKFLIGNQPNVIKEIRRST